MTWDQIGVVLVELEHDAMTADEDWRYQAVTAHVAHLVTDPALAVRLERATLTCHHCGEDRQGSDG